MLKIIKLGASWCGPCRQIKSIIEDIKKETGIEVISYDADEHEKVFSEYDVRAVPTLIFLKNDVEVARKVGMVTKDVLIKMIEELKNEN